MFIIIQITVVLVLFYERLDKKTSSNAVSAERHI